MFLVSSVPKVIEQENVRLEISSHQSILELQLRRHLIKILLVLEAEV